MINTFNLAGWGELEIVKNNISEKTAVFHIKNSPVAIEFLSSKKPVCHTNRGFLAGGACKVSKTEVDCVETKCIAMKNPYCEYITMPKNKLSKIYPKLVKEQL